MAITVCTGKLHCVQVTAARLDYEGSITIDADILKAVDIIPGEKVHVLNENTGHRLETYVIAGKAASGQICLNGPAARLGYVGDKIIVLSYVLVTQDEARAMKVKAIYLDDANKIKT